MPDGKRLGTRLSIDLAAPSGQWHGECNRQECDVLINLQKKTHFNQPGPYKFTIKQHMRQDSLLGINSVSLKIKEIEVGIN